MWSILRDTPASVLKRNVSDSGNIALFKISAHKPFRTLDMDHVIKESFGKTLTVPGSISNLQSHRSLSLRNAELQANPDSTGFCRLFLSKKQG